MFIVSHIYNVYSVCYEYHSCNSIYSGCPPPWFPKPNEDKLCDIHRLAQRQRQIDMGKETVGYERYTQTIPKYVTQTNY